MKTTVSRYSFCNAFREVRPGNFSYEGLNVLWDYLEQLEEDMGEEMELDVIAICCDYSEETPKAIAENYSIDISDCGDDENEIMASVREWLEDEGAFVGATSEGTIIYRNV